MKEFTLTGNKNTFFSIVAIFVAVFVFGDFVSMPFLFKQCHCNEKSTPLKNCPTGVSSLLQNIFHSGTIPTLEINFNIPLDFEEKILSFQKESDFCSSLVLENLHERAPPFLS